MNDVIEKQKHKIAQEKSRIQLKEKLLQEKERKLKVKKSIEIGKIFAQAGIDTLDSNELLGALLEIKQKAQDKSTLNSWALSGEKAINTNRKNQGSDLIIAFGNTPSESITNELKKLKFKWNRFRQEWYGNGKKEELVSILASKVNDLSSFGLTIEEVELV